MEKEGQDKKIPNMHIRRLPQMPISKKEAGYAKPLILEY